MLRKTLGIIALGFGIGSGGTYLLEKTGIFDTTPKKASKEYLEGRQRQIINLLNHGYTHHINNITGSCTLSLTGRAREKIIITLVCGDRLVMPHITTEQYSKGNFSTRIDTLRVENGKFGMGACITIKNEEVEGTTCVRKEEEYSPISKRG